MQDRGVEEQHAIQSVLEGWVEEGTAITDLLVPAEFNHELFPKASTSLNPDEKFISFTIKTPLPDGRVVERTMEVEGSPRLGLPGIFDEEVYAGVMALAERKGGLADDGSVRFSLYELKEILRLPTNAENYRKLRDSLMRWQRTSLTTQGALYLADTEEYASGQGYNMWAVQWARDSRPGRAKTELNEVKFHEFFIRNYQAGYIKSFDWDFYLSLGRGLRGGTLKRLYRLIDAQRAGTLEWRTTVQSLMGQVPIPPSYKYRGKARGFLERHHPELVNRGFLEAAEIADDYEVYYRVDARFVGRQRHLSLAEDPRDRAAIERLMSFRMREKAARHLVALRGAALCQRYMDALPYQKNVRSPAGWLKTYIEGDHNGPFPPKQGFAPAAAATAGTADAGTSAPADLPLDPSPASNRPVLEAVETLEAHEVGGAQEAREARELFAEVLAELNLSGDGSSTRVSLEEDLATGLQAGCLTLSVPVRSAREYVETHLRPRMEGALRRRLGEHAILRVVCPPGAGPTSEDLRREFETRRHAGEFDRAIETFETLPHEDYRRWVGQEPLHPDGNRYHLSLDGHLSVCIGGRGPEYRFFLVRLDRPAP